MKCNNKRAFGRAVNIYDSDKLTNFECALIKRFFKGKRILDVGCGCGRTTINLYKRGFSVIGIDYSKPLIKRAKEKYPFIQFKLMDASRLKFKSNYFDTLFFSYNGLDYIFPNKKRIRFLKEAHRVLKKEGILVYSSHKRFYFKWPFTVQYPFIRIHYILSMFLSIFSFNNFRYEKHPFGWLTTYCKNNSSSEPKSAGFYKVCIISQEHTNNYICQKK